MNVLLIGSGGREHALARKLAASPRLTKLFIAPGNPGTADCGENVVLDVKDHAAVLAFCRLMGVGLVVVGPEGPLVAGLADDLRAGGIAVFGHGRGAARLEGSKAFTKALCDEAGVPTAAYARFTDAAAAKAYVTAQGAPIVVKYDGLAAGKGVVVAGTVTEACDAVDMMFAGQFGGAAEVVIEEFMEGERRASSPSSMGSRCCRSRPRRTTSVSATATLARTRVAWAPIRPPPSSRPPSRPR